MRMFRQWMRALGIRPRYVLELSLPAGMVAEYQSDKVRLKGPRKSVVRLAEDISRLAALHNGQLCRLDKLTLKVSDYLTGDRHRKYWIELPPHLWSMMAGQFLQVARKHAPNPYDFNHFGFKNKNPYDIGIEVTDLPVSPHTAKDRQAE